MTRRVRKSQDVHSNPFQLLYLCKRQKGSPDTKKRSLTSCNPVELSTKSLYQVDHSVIDEIACQSKNRLAFLLFLVPIFLMKGDGVSGVKSFSEVDQEGSCAFFHVSSRINPIRLRGFGSLGCNSASASLMASNCALVNSLMSF